MKNYRDKNILITGGSSGIGLALAELLVSEGANVWILARREDNLKKALVLLQAGKISEDQTIGTIQADVSDYSALKIKIEEVFSANNPPQVLVNCAGVIHPGEFLELDSQDFFDDISIDYLGTVNSCKVVAPMMAENRDGHIVNISSLAGLVSMYGYSTYSPAKAAVKSFSAALRTELHKYDIAISIVYPADTETPQLEYDNAHKPAITKEITEVGGYYSATQTAQGILKGMKQGKYEIMPSLWTKMLKPFAQLVEKVIHLITLSIIKKRYS